MEQASMLCKTLTTILNDIRPEAGQAMPGYESAKDRAYNHIATLLTCGTEDDSAKDCGAVAVTGSRTMATIVVTNAESGRPDSPCQQGGLSQPYLAENQTRHQGFRITDIQPRPNLSLSEIVFDSDPDEDVSLFTHASDILKALKSIQGADESSLEYQTLIGDFLILALCRSLPKIEQRILGAKYIYQKPIFEILESWVPTEVDDLDFSGVYHPEVGLPETMDESEAWVAAPPPISYKLLDSCHFPRSRFNNKFYFRLNLETAPILIKVIARAYEDVRQEVLNSETSDSARPYVEAMEVLYVCLYQFLPFLEVIMDLHSMHYHLNSFHIKPNDAESALEAQARAEFNFAFNDKPSEVLLRYLKTVVAWNRAVYCLTQSELLRSGYELKLYIIQPPPDCYDTKLLSADELMHELGFDDHTDEWREKTKRLIENFISQKFSGTVHCQATLMGLIVAAERGDPPLAQELVDLLQGSIGVIGGGKKSCYTCDFLSYASFRFHLPGTTGIVTPWAPPFGIPLSVLNKVNDILKIHFRHNIRYLKKSRTARS